jgi:hypothetical protein
MNIPAIRTQIAIILFKINKKDKGQKREITPVMISMTPIQKK